ncbi:MAG: cupin domain-containing protein [Dehalococcoidia bacterium]|nr:cupin domain-containing protein [Dehalococcoidia bacterium]
MAEREVQRGREAEARQARFHDAVYTRYNALRVRAETGRVVIKGNEIPWEQSPQARTKWFLNYIIEDTAVQGWLMFVHDIRTHSGRHRHQGGLALFAIEGKGWTVVDGVRHDWEEGDLILLPVKYRGCEHQHFNAQPGQPCKWLAMIYTPFNDTLSGEYDQKEASPDWKHG